MKKTYISPAFITVKLSVRSQVMLTGSLTTTGATFFDEDATGDGAVLTKEVIGDVNVWDDEW